MFVTGIHGMDLNIDGSKKYFDVVLNQFSFGPNLSNRTVKNIPLQPCSLKHISFNEEIVESFEMNNYTFSLCPPIDEDFNIGGKIVAQSYQYL